MVRSWVLACFVVLTLMVGFGFPRADGSFGISGDKPNPATGSENDQTAGPTHTQAPATDLVVFVSQDCRNCREVRDELLPLFWSPTAEARIGMQLIDLDGLGTGGHALRSRIDSVPTFVFMRHGREIGRVRGYPGRDLLMQAVNHYAPAAGWIARETASR